MHTISFRAPHLSITEFSDINLPDFTLVTGLNGTGKSHLLQAISQGMLGTTAAPGHQLTNPTNQVRLYDWSTMVPNDSGPVGSDTVREARRQTWHILNMIIQQPPFYINNISGELREFNLPQPYLSNPVLINLNDETLIEKMVGKEKASSFREKLEMAINRHEQSHILNRIDPTNLSILEKIAIQKKTKISLLKQDDIMNSQKIHWPQNDLFQQSFASMFVEYRDLKLENWLKGAEFANGASQKNSLSDAAFTTQFGTAPWDLVNEILNKSNLPFKIDSPNPWRYEPYQPQLTKTTNGQEVTFGALSSGEKILISFAFCVYQSIDSRNITTPPKVLLFDEIDAPLHPSMSRNLIDIIKDIIVSKFGIKVIMVTHSPSTVAIAPDDSIFTMRQGEPGLHETSKAEALNILTSGLPTLAISYSGRRQVFVESPHDAKIYDAIYGKIKLQLNSDRSLEFIATGKEINNQHVGTGCEILKQIVSDLSSSGNASVYGLVDWDGKHQPGDRLAVLGHNRFNGLENVLLDPFLVGLLVALECPSDKNLGLEIGEYFTDVVNSPTERKQELANKVTICIFGAPPSKTIVKKYRGGLVLNVDNEAAAWDDHKYEDAIIRAFPFLINAFNKHPLKLKGKLVDSILMNYPDLIPIEFEEIFFEILNKPSHADQ